MSSQDLTNREPNDEEEQVLSKLLDRVEQYIDDTADDRWGKEVDNGFYYDYGSITNAWHSEPGVEINEDWGELVLDVKNTPDYILDHLVHYCNEYYNTVRFSIGYDEHEFNAKWHWGRLEGETYLQCNVS